MTSPNDPPSSQPDPAALLALGLEATEAAAGDASTVPPPSPADLAAEFSRLEILELLGRGGMGAVYKARQRDLDRLVALKILRPGLDADPGFAERFTREARALAQLNHPGIVTLYEFGKTTAGRYFILMEFVDGMNLRQLLSGGRLSPREALAIVPPLCDALQYAHDRGVIHRDIKPENILVDRLGRVKIADFGIARLSDLDGDSRRQADATPAHSDILTFTGEVMGTPAYMAPEQRTASGGVDHRADLYALGVVFYQTLTGELPAAGQLQPPSSRVRIDVRLDEIVLRALEKDPARRYASATEFKTGVETARSRLPDTENQTENASGNPLKRRRSASLLLLFTLLAALSFAAWRWLPHERVQTRETLSARTTPINPKADTPSSASSQPDATVWVEVTGAVNKPGRHPLRANPGLLDAIAAAGGWTSIGDQSAILITTGADTRVHDLGGILQGEAINPRIHDGATIFVPNRNR